MLRNKNNIEVKRLDLEDCKAGFEFEIDYLRQYVNRLADPVSNLVDELEEEIASNLDSNPDTTKKIGEEYYAETLRLRGYFYNSLAVLTYTVYESSLQKLCQQLKSKTNSQLCYSQLRNNDTPERLLLYIKILTGINGKADNGTYSRLKQFQNLRNKITHQNSQIHASNSKELHIELTNLSKVFNRGVLDNEPPKLMMDFKNGYFSINSISLIIEFIDLVESNITYIHLKLAETEFAIETNT